MHDSRYAVFINRRYDRRRGICLVLELARASIEGAIEGLVELILNSPKGAFGYAKVLGPAIFDAKLGSGRRQDPEVNPPIFGCVGVCCGCDDAIGLNAVFDGMLYARPQNHIPHSWPCKSLQLVLVLTLMLLIELSLIAWG